MNTYKILSALFIMVMAVQYLRTNDGTFLVLMQMWFFISVINLMGEKNE